MCPQPQRRRVHDAEKKLDELRRRFEESSRRSRSRREVRRSRRPSWVWRLLAAGAIGAAAAAAIVVGPALIAPGGEGPHARARGDRMSGPTVIALTSDTGPVRPYRMQDDPPPAAREGPPRRLPRARGIAAARSYARSRDGLVSFAVVDSRGRHHGLAPARRYVSASVVKVMLLAAELDRLRAAGLPLDPGTRHLLSAMITYSDNDAADSIYYRVGDGGLFAVARRARMRDFTVSGYWANAEISARDMAGLMGALDRVLVGPHADFAAGLLAAIVPAQRWGVPAVAPEGWRVRFKGGWRGTERGQLVHQIARLERGRREIALAVLTDGQPTMAYGIETVREVAERLLSRSRPAPHPGSDRRSSSDHRGSASRAGHWGDLRRSIR